MQRKIAVEFHNSEFNTLHVVTLAKEKMYIDSSTTTKFVVIYESNRDWMLARSRWTITGVTIGYKVLDNYIADVNEIHKLLVSQKLIAA